MSKVVADHWCNTKLVRIIVNKFDVTIQNKFNNQDFVLLSECEIKIMIMIIFTLRPS